MMRRGQDQQNDNAVSEAIGFMLIFALVVGGIGLVSLYGYPMLLKQQISADEKTMGQTLISLQNDMKLLSYSNVPFRDLPLRVSGGSLNIFDSSDGEHSFSLYYQNATPPQSWQQYGEFASYTPGEIRYVSDDGPSVISLENGAVLKRQQNAAGSTIIAEPRWFIDNNTITGERTLVIFLIGLEKEHDFALSGIGNLKMKRTLEPVVNDSKYDLTGGGPKYDFKLHYEDSADDYSKAWENYFTGSDLDMQKVGSDYTIQDIDRIVIKKYTITIYGI